MHALFIEKCGLFVENDSNTSFSFFGLNIRLGIERHANIDFRCIGEHIEDYVGTSPGLFVGGLLASDIFASVLEWLIHVCYFDYHISFNFDQLW